MILAWVLCQASDAHPLSCFVVKRDRSLEVDPHHFGREELCLHNGYLNLVACHTDELVNCKDDGRSNEEVPEERVLYQTARAMEEHENVEHVVPVVGEPKCLEPISAGVLGGKHEDHHGDQ